MIARALFRAHQLRKIGHGQMYLVEREWLSDGRVMQRTNEGRPDIEDEWKQIRHWSDLEAERANTARAGWESDYTSATSVTRAISSSRLTSGPCSRHSRSRRASPAR